MPKKPTPKATSKAEKQPPQRQVAYAAPQGLGDALRKLSPPPEPEHVREGRRLIDRMLSGQTGDRAGPSPPAPARRKQGSGGGRRPAFKQKQLTEIQREDRSYR